jgi:LytR cell envelope-related transcriptional attenuator
MDLYELIDRAGDFVAIAATVGIVLLLPLYFSQRRDLIRLRDWMEREPKHPVEDLVASETILDRAETELETLMGEAGPAADTEVRPAPMTPAAARVTSERPALERITMERAALEPHPRWRQFAQRVTQPRVLLATGAVALIVGVVAIFASERLLTDGEEGGGGGSFDPSSVTVAVLNGTSAPGLAQKVGGDVQSNGFELGTISNAKPGFQQTVVRYEPGQKRPANKVAHALGVTAVQEVDRATQRIAGDADVIVIAGEDRARP